MFFITHRGVNGEGYDQDAGQHVHHGDGQEEEVVGPVEVVTLLDDHTEDEVAEEPDDDDAEVEDDIAPAGHLARVRPPRAPVSVLVSVAVSVTLISRIVTHPSTVQDHRTSGVPGLISHPESGLSLVLKLELDILYFTKAFLSSCHL